MLKSLQGYLAKEQTREITSIPASDGSQRYIPLPLEADQETRRYIDRDMHPKVLKAQMAHAKKPGQKKKVR